MHNITLIGMPGSGKTTLGKTLAEGLSYHFIDTDDVIIETYGQPLMELIDKHGTEGFITLEGKILQSIHTNRAVISTGGSLHAMETLVAKAGGTVAGRMAVLAEGDAKNRDDIKFLAPLPTFKADGSVR